MSLDKIANETLDSIEQALGTKLTAEQRRAVAQAIQKSMTRTVDHTGRKYRKATQDYLSADADLAHKIADEIRRANIALKANLDSLR